MKKLAVLLAGAFVLGSVSVASADPLLCTDLGCAGANDAGYIVVLDGAVGNPDPLDGFIGVTDDPGVDCDSEGGPYTAGTPTDDGCNPPA